MNRRNAMQWLLGEIDDLVASGVLDAPNAEALRKHYAERLAAPGDGGKTVLLSVLGAALIGAGVILLVAHNWDGLGRPARVALSLLPLLVSGALSLYVAARRLGSTAWRESVGVAQSAGVAASIALVSQTYHISGELSDFLLTWLVLTLPVPYLLRAVMPALIYLAGIAVWAGSLHGAAAARGGYWLALAGIAPFCFWIIRRDRLGKAAAWISGAFVASAAAGLFQVCERDFRSGLWIPAYAGLFGAAYLTGVLEFPERRRHPWRVMGALGMLAVTLILSFKGCWPDKPPEHAPGWLQYLQAALLPLAGIALWIDARAAKRDFNVAAAAFPVFGLAAYGLIHFSESSLPAVGALFANFYGVALALVSAFRGLRERAVLTLNGGLLLLAALLIARFMDSEFGLLERGVAFIVLGGLFLGANLWMLKHKKEAAV